MVHQPEVSTKKPRLNKFVAGFVALATATTIGTAGIVSAAPLSKPTKADCAKAGYTNYGQCVKEWATAKKGSGYGGGGNTNNVHANISFGDVIDSTVNVVINIFN